jgi:hypothetical protein
MNFLPRWLRRFAAALSTLVALPAQAPSQSLAIAGLPADAPVAVTASHDGVTLRIVADLQRGWHLYGRDVGGGQPVAVTITGGAFAAAGPLRTPMGDDGLITGKATLELPLQRRGDGDALAATMNFMVCDALQCLPPIELTLGAPAAAPAAAGPFPVLLVAIDDGERTQRIAGFLRARGFAATVATYSDVTAAICDAADVVVADSPTFGQVRGKKAPVEAFPATTTPIVAVGFLGTRLLEANKVAMACGYI